MSSTPIVDLEDVRDSFQKNWRTVLNRMKSRWKYQRLINV